MCAASRQRRCIVTGVETDKSTLVRFAVDPTGCVVPDIAAKLPGRGAWVESRRDTVTAAIQGKAFARAFGLAVVAHESLPSVVEAQLARRCLDMLGLARRGGEAVAGFEKARAWLRSGRAAMVLHASNGSGRERERLVPSTSAISTVTLFDDAELGLALGRESVVHAAVAVGGFANRLLREASRLEGFRVSGESGAD